MRLRSKDPSVQEFTIDAAATLKCELPALPVCVARFPPFFLAMSLNILFAKFERMQDAQKG